jgi:hypothetical protein
VKANFNRKKIQVKESNIFSNLHTASKRVRKFQIFNYTLVLFYGEFNVCITSVIIAKSVITIQVKLNIVNHGYLLFYNKFSQYVKNILTSDVYFQMHGTRYVDTKRILKRINS